MINIASTFQKKFRNIFHTFFMPIGHSREKRSPSTLNKNFNLKKKKQIITHTKKKKNKLYLDYEYWIHIQ